MPALNIFIGHIYYSGTPQGFSEAYYLKGTTKDAAVLNLQALVTKRKAMLHESIEIVFSNVSQLGVKRDSFITQNDVQAGDSTITTWQPNRLSDAILLRQETATGKVSNRYVHGVPDGVIVAGLYDAAALTGAWDTTLDDYITKVLSETAYLNKVDKTDPTTWVLVDWAKVVKRGATSHKVGRPFDLRRGRRITA